MQGVPTRKISHPTITTNTSTLTTASTTTTTSSSNINVSNVSTSAGLLAMFERDNLKKTRASIQAMNEFLVTLRSDLQQMSKNNQYYTDVSEDCKVDVLSDAKP